MSDSIFTKIIKGEIPSYKVYEDNMTLAFLDVFPKTDGHTLVIPKVQVANLWDLPDEYFQAVMDSSRKVAKHLKKVLGVKYIGAEVIGVDVPHAHVHLVPFNDSKEYLKLPDRNNPPDTKKLEALAEKLFFEVE